MITSKMNLNFYLRRVFGVNGRIEFITKRFPKKDNPDEKEKVILIVVNIPLIKNIEEVRQRIPLYDKKTLSKGRITLEESENVPGIYYLTGIVKCTDANKLLKLTGRLVDRMMFTIFGSE